jgi:hypothetical protein
MRIRSIQVGYRLYLSQIFLYKNFATISPSFRDIALRYRTEGSLGAQLLESLGTCLN